MLLLKSKYSQPYIPSVDEMHVHLNREIDRASRYNYEFSLVIYDLKKLMIPQISSLIKQLVTSMGQRLRDSDIFGFYDRDQLAIILPYTNMATAETISENICQPLGISFASCQSISTFPNNWYHPVVESEIPSENSAPTARYRHNDAQKNRGQKGCKGDETCQSFDNVQHTETAIDGHESPKLAMHKIGLLKRASDILISTILLIVLSPLLIVTAAIIKIVSPGPVLFQQLRPGYKRKPFYLLKFRTMKVEADSHLHKQYLRTLPLDGGQPPLVKLPNDPRIFPFGKLLRKCSIDELPQLINVLRGEMSLIGPRPPLLYEAEKYKTWHARRFDVLPGITGLWQVSGKNKLSFTEMIRLDLQYEKKVSLLLDIKIIFLTIPTVLLQVLGTES